MAQVIPLREWRERKLLTQRELAQKSGVNVSTIVRIEQGQPARISTVRKLLAAMGMTEEDIWKRPPE